MRASRSSDRVRQGGGHLLHALRLCICTCLLATPALDAAVPVLQALFPAGGQRGSSFTMSANGVLDADVRLWTDCPGVFFVPNGKKREWQVTILADAPPGPHLVLAWNAEGASEVEWFSVGTLPEITEVEPNDELGKGQAIEKLPLCVNARLEKSGDVDGYTVKLAAGQALVGLVEAYGLGAPVDMIAHIVDDQGTRVMTVSDGRNLDPLVVFKAPKAGVYTVQLAGFSHPPNADVRLAGGIPIVYRLHLSTGPVATELFPAAATLAAKTDFEVRGYGLDAKTSRYSSAPPKGRALGEVIALSVPNAMLPPQVAVVEKAALIEKEPNNEVAQALPLKVGDSVGGRISDKDPMDRYALTAKKGDRVNLRIYARQLGSILDAVLQVFNAEGKSLLDLDDSGADTDPQTVWAAPADGVYQVVVRDRFSHGGDAFPYLLTTAPPVPAFAATLADGKPLTVEAGKTVSVKATVKLLNGFKEPLILRLAGLPAGVQAAEVAVPEKGGEVEIKLIAAADATAAQAPIRVTLWTKAEPASFRVATYSLRGEGVRGTALVDNADTLWLTVKGK
jgi:hypothetical protein